MIPPIAMPVRNSRSGIRRETETDAEVSNGMRAHCPREVIDMLDEGQTSRSISCRRSLLPVRHDLGGWVWWRRPQTSSSPDPAGSALRHRLIEMVGCGSPSRQPVVRS